MVDTRRADAVLEEPIPVPASAHLGRLRHARPRHAHQPQLQLHLQQGARPEAAGDSPGQPQTVHVSWAGFFLCFVLFCFCRYFYFVVFLWLLVCLIL